MMFHRVSKDAFYDHVIKSREAATRNGLTTARRKDTSDTKTQRISYEVNGIPNAQAVKHAIEDAPRYYVLR